MEVGNRGSTPSAAGAKRGVGSRSSRRRYGGRHIELARAASNPHPPWRAEGSFQAGCKVWRRVNRASSSCSAGEGAARRRGAANGSLPPKTAGQALAGPP